MSKALDLARYYFDLSNKSDFSAISKLFDDNSTFYTRSGEYFIGVDNIMAMQKAHHHSYKKLHWQVTHVEEVKTGVTRFEFDFSAVDQQDQLVQFSGVEYVIINNGIIRHIDVQGIA